MSDLTALSKESIKGLGAGAYLVNVLPSAVLVLTIAALVDSRLLPWAGPRMNGQDRLPAGYPSVADAVRDRGVPGGIVLLLAVIVLAVLLRPFQIGTVQLLEGYWTRGGLAKDLAVERHTRRASRIDARIGTAAPPPVDNQFGSVARSAREQAKANQINTQAAYSAWRYPARAEHVMPTALGNVLRRAEITAGERYGMNTVVTYPRLYPHLSPRLDAQMSEQLNAIDVMATFVVVFGAQAIITAPLLVRLDWWSAVPVVLFVLVTLAYRGAVTAAQRQGILLATAFDLHRFDMLAAMHVPMPLDAETEQATNRRLTALLLAEDAWPERDRQTWVYAHPDTEDKLTPEQSTPAEQSVPDGAAGKKESDGEAPGESPSGSQQLNPAERPS